MRSPKLARDRAGDWYRYYAGYSQEFVEDALATFELDPGSTVLDPWNGSGTTTFVAHEQGFSPCGFDANPALVVIARARLLGAEVVESLVPLAADILEHASDLSQDQLPDDDPLERWFQVGSAHHVRRIEWAIQHVLVEHGIHTRVTDGATLDRLSALAAFFYVALFESVRSELRSCVGSNPTWVRQPAAEERLTFAAQGFDTRFSAAVERLAVRLASHLRLGASESPGAVHMANSVDLPLVDACVEAAVTSPPYCTRIDYVVATRPELAVLGFGDDDLRALRRDMVGTPTIHRETPVPHEEWGATALTLLRRIEGHSSRASGTYYRKYFTQYVDSLWRSLRELRRVLRSDGQAAIVVQDSYYKEVHVDLARIVHEMAGNLGWREIQQSDLAIAKTKAAINPRARSWRSNFSATESVLILR